MGSAASSPGLCLMCRLLLGIIDRNTGGTATVTAVGEEGHTAIAAQD